MAKQATEQRLNETTQVEEFGLEISVPKTATDVVPINYEKALASYTEVEQQEILALADSVDVRKTENAMSYGAEVLKNTFEQCGNLLKDERGSHADQEVIKRVIELSKKASDSNEEFNNLVLQEPNRFRKLLLKVMSGSKGTSKTEKIQKSAVTNYTLLTELKKSCDSWNEMLRDAMGDIQESAISDFETVCLEEKYLIAGHIAEERTIREMQELENQYKETGLNKYAFEYQKVKEGYEIFQRSMYNLEKSRVMYYLSMGQLALIAKSNRNVQMVIRTQVDHSMALVGQQLRNALLDAKTREVLEGQKAIVALSNELIKDVSQSVGLTAEQTEKALYASFYNTEAAKTAINTVVESCERIQKTAEEMLPKMKADLSELNGLIEELEPVVGKSIQTLKNDESVGSIETTGLKF